jgi:hypothetical protein
VKRNMIRLFFIIFAAITQSNCFHYSASRAVPPGFAYPESGASRQNDKIIIMQRVAGRVVDVDNDPIEEVIAEIETTDYEKRLAAVFTDRDGRFLIKDIEKGEYVIRFTKPYMKPFQSLLRVTSSGQTSVKVVMTPAT